MKQCVILILSGLAVCMMTSCGSMTQNNYELSAKNRELLDYFDGLYNLPQNNPARFALNEIAERESWRAFKLLSGAWPGSGEDRRKAAETLMKLRVRIEKGFRWPYATPPVFIIPYTVKPPDIDGRLSDSCWNHALTLKGRYPVGSTGKESEGSVWKIMWDKQYLYIGVIFPDAGIIVSAKPGHPYLGDALEIFLLPSLRLKDYWEIIIGADGDLFDGLHHNNKWGGFIGSPKDSMAGLRHKCSNLGTGFSVETAIPFKELPNYQLGNAPKPEETIYFALLRTEKNSKDGCIKSFSSFPLLYGGHNIFGYAKGILATSNWHRKL